MLVGSFLWATLASAVAKAATLPPLIPAVHSFSSASGNAFKLPSNLRIVVDAAHAASTADNGLTLIPPTVEAFARTFATDLHEIFPTTSVNVTVTQIAAPKNGDIVITLLSEAAAANFTLAKGAATTEGYEMDVTADGVTIRGSGAKGSFWATRTLLQGLVLGGGSFPAGTIRDQPDWQTRGFMLDVARQFYPITFLADLCTYASWFKISEFHVHLSDNVPAGNDFNRYARFRLLSAKNPGLTPHPNETYTHQEFEDFQQHCASRGVTIVPEFEAPGHALVISQWKPELARSEDPTLLNLTMPEATEAVKSIWEEFLPWIHSKQVSIGADEYPSDLADDYNAFVNTMSDFIAQQSGKVTRIWGTREPSNTTSVTKNITIQHWSFGDDDPFELIQEGYTVINSDDGFQYIVMKQPASGSFGSKLNQTRLWEGANVATGGIWDPSIFDQGNATNNPKLTEPRLQGGIMAAWNDHGRNASTYLEAYYALKEGLPVIAAANWQAASRPAHLTHAQFLASFPSLEAHAPGQNLARRVPSKGAVVAQYDLTQARDGPVPDKSGNGYAGTLRGGVLTTPLGSKGHNYTLLLATRAGARGAGTTFLAGPDDAFAVVGAPGGKTTLAFVSTNITFPLNGYVLPAGSGVVEIVVVGTEAGTAVWVNGTKAGEFMVQLERSTTLVPMAFVAPVQRVSGATRFELWDGVQDVTKISRR